MLARKGSPKLNQHRQRIAGQFSSQREHNGNARDSERATVLAPNAPRHTFMLSRLETMSSPSVGPAYFLIHWPLSCWIHQPGNDFSRQLLANSLCTSPTWAGWRLLALMISL